MTGHTKEDTPAGGAVRLRIAPRSDYYAPDDQRRAEEAFELEEAFRRELPDEVEPRPAERTKGVITDVVIPLASSGAFTAATELFKAWLSKEPANRSIDVEFEVEEGGKPSRSGSLQIDATNVDDAVLDTIAKEALNPGQ